MAFGVTCIECGHKMDDAVDAGWCPDCGTDVIKSIKIE